MIEDPFLEPLVVDRDALRQLGIGYTNAHLLRLESQGRFPKRVGLGGRKTVWKYSEIREWVAQKCANRDESAAQRSAIASRGIETRGVTEPYERHHVNRDAK